MSATLADASNVQFAVLYCALVKRPMSSLVDKTVAQLDDILSRYTN